MKIPGWNNVSAAGLSVPSDLGTHQAIGLRFDRCRAELRAVAVAFPPLIQKLAPHITAVASRPISTSLLRQLRTLEMEHAAPGAIKEVRQEIFQLASSVVQDLLALGLEEESVLAMGCHGAGIWLLDGGSEGSYWELFDASRLAEAFGRTVICDFPSRDLARNAPAGPVESHGLGLLLADRDSGPGYRWRGLVEISDNACRFTLIPPFSDNRRIACVYSDEVGPSLRLLVELKMTAGGDGDSAVRAASDASGHVVPELIRLWETAVGGTREQAAWSTAQSSCLPLLYALDQSEFRGLPLADLLATAEEFLVGRIAQHVLYGGSVARPVGELFVMGEGVQNESLMRSLANRLAFLPLRKLDELGHDRTVLAASVAALAMLHIWHIPLATREDSTTPRVLGSLTPGSPNNWHRVLHEMTLSMPGLLPLREAI